MPVNTVAGTTFRGRLADSLSRFGILGTIAFLAITATVTVFTPLAAALVLVWAWLSRTGLRTLGLRRPRSWIAAIGAGIALGLIEKFVMKAVVLPLLGAPPSVNPLGELSPRRIAFLIVYLIVGAGFCEELFFRGYLFERLGRLWGESTAAQVLTVLVTTVFFAGLHYPQGAAGIENAGVLGLLSAIIYATNGRRLWLLVVAHATFDLGSLALEYFHLESLVAHSVLR